MRTADIVDRLRSSFETNHHGALAVYLFGSTAREASGPQSDVDLALLHSELPTSQTLDSLPLLLKGDLEELLGLAVDVVVLNTASPDLCHRVFRDGIVLLDRDRRFRLRFEVTKRNEYLDFLPVLQLYRRYPKPRVDPYLIAKKLALIETCVRELRTMARPETLAEDIREQRFIEHTLQIAIQAALDAASHIVADERLGEPSTYRQVFELLEKAGYVSLEISTELEKMAGFRNVLVHGYDSVDLAIVKDIVENRLDDLEQFAKLLRERLP